MSAPDTQRERYEESEPTPAEAARINKWLAMFAYTHGYASERQTVEAFASHPEWRSA